MKDEKNRKWLLAVLASLAGILLLVLFAKSTEEQVSDFVAKNQSALEVIALTHLAGDRTVDRYKQAEAEGVYGSIVQFSYASSGLMPATKYCGFYYSKDGTPAAFQNADIPLEQTADGAWQWSDGTDNGGVTKRLTGHWFYYEAWF